MSESETADAANVQLSRAYTAFYADVGNATKNAKNPHLGNFYADLGSVLLAIKPHLAKHKLSILQVPGKMADLAGNMTVSVISVLMHEAGGRMTMETQVPLAPKTDKKTGKDKYGAQEAGSAITYARRYALSAICGITQQDDDGNASQGDSGESDAQSEGAGAGNGTEEADLPSLLRRIESAQTVTELEAVKADVQEAGDKTVAKAYVARMRLLKQGK